MNSVPMRRVLVTALMALVALGLAGSASALKLVRVTGGYTNPVYATGAPGNRNAVFVVGQNGYITRFNGTKHPFLDINNIVQSDGNEEGLLSVAFHPRYQQNRRLFVFYTNNEGNLRIVGYRANDNGTRVLESTAKLWAAIQHQPNSNHNGGQLQFGLNGKLYVSVGDGGSGGDDARNLGTRRGKLLVINVDNPNGRARIAASGLRNPWRFSVDSKTGRFFMADVGQEMWEEIDIFRPGRSGLENFGWNRFEGNHRYSGNPLGPGRYVRPIHEYSHSAGRCSVTGGFVVRNGRPGAGRYFYGDYCTGEVWSFRYRAGQKSAFRREAFTVPGNLSSFGISPRGALLVVSHGGTVYRVARN